MDDLISRQAVIDGVLELNTEHRVSWQDAVIDMVDALPSAQPNLQPTCNQLATDCISRQAAIDAADRSDYTGLAVEDVKKVTDEVVKELKQLPSAQPYTEEEIQKMQDLEQAELDKAFELGQQDAQPEIIRCKDCRHSEHWYGDKRRCFLWHKTGIDVFEDGYCNYAERRTDV